jgi:hypothetical protein
MEMTDNLAQYPIATIIAALAVAYMVGVAVSIAITEDADFALSWPLVMLYMVYLLVAQAIGWVINAIRWVWMSARWREK